MMGPLVEEHRLEGELRRLYIKTSKLTQHLTHNYRKFAYYKIEIIRK